MLIQFFLNLNFSLQRRIQNLRLNSPRKHRRRRKEEVAAKPRRRSGPKEKSVTN
jgi:hypothetical protein